MKRLLLLGAFLIAILQLGDALPKRVEILHAPHIITDDTELSFDVRAVADERNRLLVVAAVDEVGIAVRSSDEDLTVDSPVTRRIAWNTLSAGDYELVAQTFGADDKALARDRSHLTVLEWRGP